MMPKVGEEFPVTWSTSARKKRASKIKSRNDVSERLTKLGNIFRDRNAVYGDTFRSFGVTMTGLFPEGLSVKTVDDWNRLALLMHVIDKLNRYCSNFSAGGHADSLDDLTVYSQILQMLDTERPPED